MPDELKSKVHLLRSYFKEVPGFENQSTFLYAHHPLPWQMEDKLLQLQYSPKKFDAVYCGNVYGRRDEFLKYFKPFSDNNLRVCIQGNWLRKKYDDRDFALDNFPNFMFFGSTPHWTTLPSIAISKSVIQFSNPAQQEAGLPTARIFETYMGKGVVFCSSEIQHIERVVPEELIVTGPDDLYNKWEKWNWSPGGWMRLRKLFEQKMDVPEFRYSTRVWELENLVSRNNGTTIVGALPL
jgi:hypothetical protein